MVLADLGRRRSLIISSLILLLLLQELLAKILRGLIDSLLHVLPSLRLSHEEWLLVATKARLSHLALHIFACGSKHLLLHLRVVLVLLALFLSQSGLDCISLILTARCALEIALHEALLVGKDGHMLRLFTLQTQVLGVDLSTELETAIFRDKCGTAVESFALLAPAAVGIE